jgi:hypothetical protein
MRERIESALFWLVALPFLLIFGRGGVGGSGDAKPPPPPPSDRG